MKNLTNTLTIPKRLIRKEPVSLIEAIGFFVSIVTIGVSIICLVNK
jgi:hypothetical protein